MDRLLIALALVSFAWMPSDVRGQESGEVECTKSSQPRDSTTTSGSGQIRLRSRTAPPSAGYIGLGTVTGSGPDLPKPGD